MSRLLYPEEIVRNMLKLRRKQYEVANAVGISTETISRIVNGHNIQNRSTDNLLRLYFEVPAARRFLDQRAQ